VRLNSASSTHTMKRPARWDGRGVRKGRRRQ
jgi:hypothetical protein